LKDICAEVIATNFSQPMQLLMLINYYHPQMRLFMSVCLSC